MRQQILHQLKKSLANKDFNRKSIDLLSADLAQPPIQPPLEATDLVPKFIQQVTKVAGTVEILSTPTEIPFAVLDFLQQQHLPLKIITDKALQTFTWSHKLQLVDYNSTQTEEVVSINQAFAGIAETGSVVLLSGAINPTTLNFLSATHIVVLYQIDLVAYFEDIWERLRQQTIPRSVNIITGPSRTADIEQTIQLGAHGPKQLHLFLVKKKQGEL